MSCCEAVPISSTSSAGNGAALTSRAEHCPMPPRAAQDHAAPFWDLEKDWKSRRQRCVILVPRQPPLCGLKQLNTGHFGRKDALSRSLFSSKARSRLQFLHTPGKEKMGGLILPDPRTSAPSALHAYGSGVPLSPRESCRWAFRPTFSTTPEGRTQQHTD